MNDSKNALSNLTKSRWLRLSASVGLAFGLAVVMLMLPLFAGTTVTVTVPQLSSAPDTVGKANWSLTSSSVQVGLPLGVESASASNGIIVTKTANFTTYYYQGGLVYPSSTEPGEIEYTISAFNSTGSNLNPPFYISDTIPAGTVCSKTDNNGLVNWTHNFATCLTDGVAQFTLASGVWTNGITVTVKFYVKPIGTDNGFAAFAQSNTVNGVYTVTNGSVTLHNPGGWNGGIKDNNNPVNVKTAVKAPVWSITKNATPIVQPGGMVEYEIDIANTGPYTINPNVANLSPFTNKSWVTITEWLPTGVVSDNISYTPLSTNTNPTGFVTHTNTGTTTKITWVITQSDFCLAPAGLGNGTCGDSLSFWYNPLTVTYRTPTTLAAGLEIINSQYKVEGGDNVFYPGWGTPATTTVQGAGFLTITKYSTVGNNGLVTPGGLNLAGQKFTYTIKYTYGSSIATVNVVDTLPVAADGGGAYSAFIAATPGLLVDYLGSSSYQFSCVGGSGTTTGTVTASGSPVSSLAIKSYAGDNGTVCTVNIPVQMHSYMPDGLTVRNNFGIIPVVTSTVKEGTGVNTGAPSGGYDIYYVNNTVDSDTAIQVTKSVFPTVVDPYGDNNITYTLIITQGGGANNGWDRVSLYDDLVGPANVYTGWAVFAGAKPNLITVSASTPAAFTYTNSLFWNEQGQGIWRVITAGTDLNDRFFELKAKVMTKTPTYNGGKFCNDDLDVNFGSGGGYNPTVNTLACVTVAAPQITVSKVATWSNYPAAVLPGSKVYYTFTVTNTGSVDVNNILITDVFASGTLHTPIVLTDLQNSTLAMSGSSSISVRSVVYTYTVAAGDVQTNLLPLPGIYNNVTVTAKALVTPALSVPPIASATSYPPYTVPVFISQTISMTKIATWTNRLGSYSSLPTWGDTITYTYYMTNNSTFGYLFTSLVDDSLGPILPTAAYNIAALSPYSPTIVKVVTLNDKLTQQAIDKVNAGGVGLSPLLITNVVTATGSFQDVASTPGIPTATLTVEITYTARASMTKSVDVSKTFVTTPTQSSVNYTLYVTNTGSVTLTGLISDSLVGDTGLLLNGSPVSRTNATLFGGLAPGASTQVTYQLPITQGLAYSASIISGTWGSWLTNTADITLTITNTNQTLLDYLTKTVKNAPTNLVTQTGLATATVQMVYTPSITISKTALPTTATVGAALGYVINVTNNGMVDLAAITLTDYMVYSGSETLPITVTNVVSFPLAAGASTAFPYTFTVDSNKAPFTTTGFAFANGGLITNSTWVTGYFQLTPGYTVTTVTANTRNVVTTVLVSDLTVQKGVAYTAPFPTFGHVVTYVYTVYNGSTLPITATLMDDKCEGLVGGCLGIPTWDTIRRDIVLSGTDSTQPLPIKNFETFTFTALVNDFFVAQALRQITPSTTLINIAKVEGKTSSGLTLPGNNEATARVSLTWTENISFAKYAVIVDGLTNEVLTNATAARVNDIIRYTFVITNNGNIGYQDYRIDDVTLQGATDCTYAFTPQRAILEGYVITPSTTISRTCDVLVTPNMMAYIKFFGNSTLVNTATAVVTPSLLIRAPQATNILSVTTKVATASVVLTSPASIQLTKVADVMTATLNDTINYTYYITNTGSIDFDLFNNPNGNGAVTLYDSKLGAIQVDAQTLAPNQGTMVKASHVVTYSDFNPNAVVSGTIWLTNSAVATGYVAPTFGTSVPSVPDTAEVALVYTVNLQIAKVSDQNPLDVLSLGQPVVYTLTLKNDSTVPVTVTLNDVYDNGAVAIGFPKTVWVAAMTSTDVVYHDAVLPAYLDSNIQPPTTQPLRNVVTATVDDGLGNLNISLVDTNVYTAFDDEILTAIYDLDVKIAKSTSTPVVHFDAATKTVTYQYVLTNSGQTTQTVAFLVDEFNNDPSLVITVAENIVLPPMTSTTVITNIGITDAYLDYAIAKGQAVVSNTATAWVASGNLVIPFDSNPVTVTVFYTPSMLVIKTANLEQAGVGDTITYTVLVANNGLVTLNNIIFEDRLLNVVRNTNFDMGPQGVANFFVTRTITLDDLILVRGGILTNVAHVTGTRGTFDWGFDSNQETVTIVAGPSLTITKIGSATSVQVPATVVYTYTVINNGKVDLTGITLTDDKLTLNVTPFDLVKNGVKVVTASTLLSTPNVTVTNLATAQALFGTTPAVATATWTVKTTGPITTTPTCTVALAPVSPVILGSASFMTATVTATPTTGTPTFAWNFGDGSAVGTVNPISHTYAATGTKTVTVTVTHSNGSTCAATTQAVVNANPVQTPNLVVTKKTERPQVLAVGTRITYTISVSNTGNAPANSVVITDVLPAEVTLVASPTTTAGTVTVSGSTIRVEVPNLAPQAAPVIVTIVVEVDNDGIGKGTIVNTAFVSSLEQTVANSGLVTDPADLNDATQVIKKPKVNVFLPIILKQPTTGTATPTATAVTPTATPVTPVPGQPNLQSTIKLPASVSANSPVVVEVEVKNVGGAAVTQGFWVEFYINPNDAAGLTTRGGRWDSDENLGTLADPSGKQGIAWFVNTSNFGTDGALTAGETITLVSLPEGDSALSGRIGFDADQTTWHGRFVSGTSTLVSYADSFAGSGKNVYIVTESNENDNANTATSFGPLGAGGVDLTRGPFHPAR